MWISWDGHYVPNLALAPYHLEALSTLTELPFEVHLELDNPDYVLEAFQEFQAQVIIVQHDTCRIPQVAFQRDSPAPAVRVGRRSAAAHPGGFILELFEEVDLLLLLGVDPGFGGQAMRDGVIDWVAATRKRLDQAGVSTPIAVDGGIRLSNAPALVDAGADVLIWDRACLGRKT